MSSLSGPLGWWGGLLGWRSWLWRCCSRAWRRWSRMIWPSWAWYCRTSGVRPLKGVGENGKVKRYLIGLVINWSDGNVNITNWRYQLPGFRVIYAKKPRYTLWYHVPAGLLGEVETPKIELHSLMLAKSIRTTVVNETPMSASWRALPHFGVQAAASESSWTKWQCKVVYSYLALSLMDRKWQGHYKNLVYCHSSRS